MNEGVMGLRPAERRRAQWLMIVEGMTWMVMFTTVFGVALTGWALALGATAWQIGLLTTVPALVRLVQIGAPRLMRPGAGRKRLAWGGLIGARVLNVPIMLLPLAAWAWPGAHPALFWLLLALVTVYNALDALGAVAWLSWATDVVPVGERGRYWAQRGMLTGAVGLVVAPAVGWVLDAGRGLAVGTTWAGQPHPFAFLIVFAVGTGAGAVTAWQMARTPHAPMAAPPSGAGLLGPLRRAFADALLRRYIAARTVWAFGAWLALPFTTVYLLQTVGLDFTTVTLLTAGGSLLSLLSLAVWGRAVDRWGCRPVVVVGTVLRAGGMAVLAFATPDAPWLWTVLLVYFAATGMGDAALQLSVGNLLMKLAPRADPAYFAAFNTTTGLAQALGPLLGSVLLALAGGGLVQVAGWTVHPLQIFFLVPAVGGTISLLWLTMSPSVSIYLAGSVPPGPCR